jgi:hypothetical protein
MRLFIALTRAFVAGLAQSNPMVQVVIIAYESTGNQLWRRRDRILMSCYFGWTVQRKWWRAVWARCGPCPVVAAPTSRPPFMLYATCWPSTSTRLTRYTFALSLCSRVSGATVVLSDALCAGCGEDGAQFRVQRHHFVPDRWCGCFL